MPEFVLLGRVKITQKPDLLCRNSVLRLQAFAHAAETLNVKTCNSTAHR